MSTSTQNPLAAVLAAALTTALAPVKTAAVNIAANPTVANVTSETTAIIATGLPTLEQTGIAEGANLILALIAEIEAKVASIGATSASAGASA